MSPDIQVEIYVGGMVRALSVAAAFLRVLAASWRRPAGAEEQVLIPLTQFLL